MSKVFSILDRSPLFETQSLTQTINGLRVEEIQKSNLVELNKSIEASGNLLMTSRQRPSMVVNSIRSVMEALRKFTV